MAAGPVSQSERQLAHSLARDTARFERRSIEAATKLGFKLMQSVIPAFRRRDPTILERVPIWFRRMEPVMTDVMVVAYLQGMAADRKRRTLSLSIHSKAIKALRVRLGVSPEMIKGIATTCEREAVAVLNKSSDLVEKRLQETILDVTRRGEHVREGVKRLHGTFGKLGITPRNSFQLETIFRTQTQMAYSAGRYQSLQDPDVQEILWGYKLVTVGDDRVRDEHEPMDGTTLPKDDPFWEINWTPNGWACRCQMIAIYEERGHVRPPRQVEIEGKMVFPGADKGFQYNPGKLFREMEGISVKPGIIKPAPPPAPKPPIPKPKPGSAADRTEDILSVVDVTDAEVGMDDIRQARNFEKSLSKRQRAALEAYRDEGKFERINQYMVTGRAPNESIARHAHELHGALEDVRLPDNMILWRGMEVPDPVEVRELLARLKVGQEVHSSGFVSVSKSSSIAGNFATEQKGGPGFLFKLKTRGVKGVSVGVSEPEHLLQSGSKVRVTKITRKPSNLYVVEGEISHAAEMPLIPKVSPKPKVVPKPKVPSKPGPPVPKPKYSVPTVKDASAWARTGSGEAGLEGYAVGKLDAPLLRVLTDESKQLLAKVHVQFKSDLPIGAAGGITRHGEIGPLVRWSRGQHNIALHELGHATTYPYGPLGKPPQFSPIVQDVMKLHKTVVDEAAEFKFHIDVATHGEAWADVFVAHHDPSRYLVFRAGMPKTAKRATELLGKSKFDVPVSPRLQEYLQDTSKRGWLYKRADLEKYGLTKAENEEIIDLLNPSSLRKGARKSAIIKSDVTNFERRVARMEELLGPKPLVTKPPIPKLPAKIPEEMQEKAVRDWLAAKTHQKAGKSAIVTRVLDEAPVYEGRCFRGVRMTDEAIEELRRKQVAGKSLIMERNASASASEEVAEYFGYTGLGGKSLKYEEFQKLVGETRLVLFDVKAKGAADIRAISNKLSDPRPFILDLGKALDVDEVVLRGNSKYKIVGMEEFKYTPPRSAWSKTGVRVRLEEMEVTL